jgi:hypothetical protein
MKEKFLKKIEESCEFLYHNHPEILQSIYQNEKITPLTIILSKHGAEIFDNILLQSNVNCIYNLISLKDLEIPQEIRDNNSKAIELQDALVKKTIEVIKDADEVFKKQISEAEDEEEESCSAEQLQQSDIGNPDHMLQEDFSKIKSLNVRLPDVSTVNQKEHIRQLFILLTAVANDSRLKNEFSEALPNQNVASLTEIAELLYDATHEVKRKVRSSSPRLPISEAKSLGNNM